MFFHLTTLGLTQIPSTLGWFQIPNTQLSSVVPDPALYPTIQGGEGPSGIVNDWSGGVADTKHNRLIVWGGGHSGYYGNEVYALDLNTLTMSRLNDPTIDIGGNPPPCNDAYPDGKAASRHTYHGLTYAPNVDTMIVISGGLPCGSGAMSLDIWSLGLPALSWNHKIANSGLYQGGIPVSDYDPNTGNVIYHDTAQLWNYNPVSNAFTTIAAFESGIADLGYPKGIFDPVHKFFFLIGDGNFFKYDMSGGNPPYIRQDLSGVVSGCDALFKNGGGHGLGAAWDSNQNKIVGWSGGDSVTILDPVALTCTSLSFPNGPGAQVVNGTYGRFRYFPALGVFALVNNWDQNAYTLRLTNGTPPPAPPVITSAGSATGTVGSAFSYQITATNSPTSFNATGLPAGLSVNTNNGLISGTPTATATSSVALSAANAGGTGNATLTLTINPSGGGGIPSTLGWYQIPNTQIQPLCPPYPEIQGSTGCESVTLAWGGAVADTKRNRMIVWNGGHLNYFGNEVYMLDLNANPITMNKVIDATHGSALPSITSNCYDAYSAGVPAPRHTYAGVNYLPSTDNYMFFGAGCVNQGSFFNTFWTLSPTWIWTGPTIGGANYGNTGGQPLSAYDSVTQLDYFYDGNAPAFFTYNPTSGSWTANSPTKNVCPNQNMNVDIDPVRRIFVCVGSGAAGKVGLAAPFTGTSLSMANCGNIKSASAPGWVYYPTQGVFVGWSGGNTVYLYNPDTDSCTSQTFTGGPPNAPTSGDSGQQVEGTYGRFRYFPSLGVFIVINDISQNAYSLRLAPAGGDTTPPSVPTGLNATAASSVQINLSWNASTDNVGVAGYKIFRGGSQVATSASTSFQDIGLTANTAYTYTVAAYDAAGNTSAQSTTASATTPSSGGTTPDADFQARCHAPGVIACQGFDATGDFAQATDPGSGFYYASDCPTLPATKCIVQDTNIFVSGGSSARWDIYGNTGANAQGNYAQHLPQAFGPGSTFYVQYAFRVDQNWLMDWEAVAGSSPKLSIFHNWVGGSCAMEEITTNNAAGSGVPMMYGECGATGFFTNPDGITPNPQSLGGPEGYLIQQGFTDPAPTTGYDCANYVNSVPGPPYTGNCFRFQANTWYTLYWKVHVGAWGQPNSSVEAYIGTSGGQLKKLINAINWTLNQNGGDAGFDSVTLTQFMTNKNPAAAHPTAHVWYDELIVSTQPIAAPGGTLPPSDTTPPSVPTGLTAVAISSTQIVANWSASTDNVGVAGYKVFRCQGAGCTPSTQVGTTASTSYLDNSLSPSTTYAYKISAFDAAGNVSALSASASAVTLSSSTASSNLPPVVSAIGTNATDVDPATPGLQIYDNTSVTYTGTASDPNGGTITWQWLYSTNGGAPVLMASGTGTVQPLTFNYPAGIAPKTYIWILSANNGVSTAQQTLTVNVIARPSSSPPPPPVDPTPGLKNVSVYPNPAVKQDPTVRAFLGQVSSVEVTIFDGSGQVVHSASLGGTPTGIINGQYYYDYTWTGRKANGVYFAVIHGKTADGTIIRARARFAVVM